MSDKKNCTHVQAFYNFPEYCWYCQCEEEFIKLNDEVVKLKEKINEIQNGVTQN